MPELLAVDRAARIEVVYQDTTPFGSAFGRFERELQARCAPVAEARTELGLAELIARSRDWWSEIRSLNAPLYDGSGGLRESVLYPDAALVQPRILLVRTAARTTAIDLGSAGILPDLARWLADWRLGASAPSDRGARLLWDALRDLGALTPVRERSVPVRGDATFVGHACVAIHADHTVLFDPFLRPRSTRWPVGYQPLGLDELEPDAVFVTHSHPDHFDPGSLLGLAPETPIFVPEVARESLLAVDMATRLRQLGFTCVRTLGWGAETAVGGIRVRALPFYGEQPTTSDVLHPEVRNAGNTYWAEANGRKYAVLADAGVDRDGSMVQVAGQVRRELGGADVVFGGYRSFALYPLNYLFTSVGRYALLVPEDLWCVRQRIMHDADDLLDVAERLGAHTVVPYADGGAPWFWESGLGPRLDALGASNVHRDPPPELVVHAARHRSSSHEGDHASPCRVRVLRPGEGLDQGRTVHHPDAIWPYAGALDA